MPRQQRPLIESELWSRICSTRRRRPSSGVDQGATLSPIKSDKNINHLDKAVNKLFEHSPQGEKN